MAQGEDGVRQQSPDGDPKCIGVYVFDVLGIHWHLYAYRVVREHL